MLGIARGGFGLIAADTRLVHGDGFNDTGDFKIETPAGPVWLATSSQRKLRRAVGPAWVVAGGGDALVSRIVLDVLADDGVGDIEHVQLVLRKAGKAAKKLVTETWGFSLDADAERALFGTGLGFIRPGPDGVDFRLVGDRHQSGGTDRSDLWPPNPLTVDECRVVLEKHLHPVTAALDSTEGELLLAVAATFEALRAAGAWSISGQSHVGFLLQSSDGSVRSCRFDFDNAELLAQSSPRELDERLRDALEGGVSSPLTAAPSRAV